MTDLAGDARATTSPVWFIGDSVTAMGYRLAGVETRSPPVEQALAILEQAARRGAGVVLLSADYAAEIDPKPLGELLARMLPVLLLVPSARRPSVRLDLAERARAVLGSES